MTLAQFSPLSQRVIAWGLVVLAVLATVQWLALPIAGAIIDSRSELAALNARKARLLSARDLPAPTFTSTTHTSLRLSGTLAAAGTALTEHIDRLAEANGLSVETDTIQSEDGLGRSLITASFVVQGPHDAVLALIAALEQGRPLVRVTTATLTAPMGQEGQLSATIEVQAVRDSVR